jgi:RNA polymerase sigma-70 factor (ECF subfamily)
METDEQLHALIRRGDLRAFDVLYLRHESALFGFLLRTLQNRADAEDALHEVFVRALKTPPSRVDAGGFRAWLFRIARNLTLNRARDRGRADLARQRAPSADRPVDADESLARHELHAALDRAIDRLPPPLAEVYRLRTSGLSYEEMASVLEAPIGTVKSRMHEMVRLLRQEVRPWIAVE